MGVPCSQEEVRPRWEESSACEEEREKDSGEPEQHVQRSCGRRARVNEAELRPRGWVKEGRSSSPESVEGAPSDSRTSAGLPPTPKSPNLPPARRRHPNSRRRFLTGREVSAFCKWVPLSLCSDSPLNWTPGAADGYNGPTRWHRGCQGTADLRPTEVSGASFVAPGRNLRCLF